MLHTHKGKKIQTLTPKGAFTQVPNEIFTIHGLTPVQKLILIYFHRYTNLLSWEFSYAKIARDLDLDESGVKRCWKTLMAKGIIKGDKIDYDQVGMMQPVATQNRDTIPESVTGIQSRIGENTGIKSQLDRDTIPERPGLNPIETGIQSRNNRDTIPDDKERDKQMEKEELKNTKDKELKNDLSVVSEFMPSPEATAKFETGNLNKNPSNMITKKKIIEEVQEREFQISIHNGLTVIFNQEKKIGQAFKVGDYDSMMKFLMDFPSTKKEEVKSSIEPYKSIQGQLSQVIQPSVPQEKKTVYTSPNEFLEGLSSTEKKRLQGLGFNQFIKETDSLLTDYDVQLMVHQLLKRSVEVHKVTTTVSPTSNLSLEWSDPFDMGEMKTVQPAPPIPVVGSAFEFLPN